MANIVDQSQLLTGTGAGFGEFANTRYRGMGFTPSIPSLTGISFNLNGLGSKDLKVYIDTADSDSIPDNPVGSEVYSFVIDNADLSTSLKEYTLPAEQTLTPEAQYCMYFAPWDGGYSDDYRDLEWRNANVYSRGKPIVNNGGTWSVSDGGNLDLNFKTHGNTDNPTIIESSSATPADDTTSLVWSHTVSSFDNRVLYIRVYHRNPATATFVSSITRDGQSATLVKKTVYNGAVAEIWRIIAPNTGTANITVTLDATAATVGGDASTVINVNQSTPEDGSPVEATGSGSSVSQSITTTVANTLILDAIYSKVGSDMSTGSGQPEIAQHDVNGGGDRAGSSYKTAPTATSYSMAWSWSGTEDYAMAIIAVQAPSGSTATSDERGAKVTGQASANDERDATLTGKATASSERSAKTTGQDSANDNRGAKVTGKDTANDTRGAKVVGKDTSNDERSAKTTGKVSTNDERSAKVTGKDTSSDSRGAKTTGITGSNDERSAKTFGKDTANDERLARVVGKETTSDTRSAKTVGITGANDERNAKVTGVDTTSDERLAKVVGSQTAQDSRSATLSGQSSSSSQIDAKTTGKQTTSSQRGAKLTGVATANDEIDAKTSGKDSSSDERSAKVVGKQSTNDSRNAKLTGVGTASSQRGARLTGINRSNDERNAKLVGIQTVTDERGAKTSGKSTASSERGSKVTGETGASSQRNAHLYGKYDYKNDNSDKNWRTKNNEAIKTDNSDDWKTRNSEAIKSDESERWHIKLD